MKREQYVVDIRDASYGRVELLTVDLEVETRFDDQAVEALKQLLVAWCERRGCEYCGLSFARSSASQYGSGTAYVLARVRGLPKARVPVTRTGRPIDNSHIARPAPTMAARRRDDSAGRA